MTRLQVRKIHRWLGLITGLQLLAWTISGLYFSLIPIETIRGEDILSEPISPTMAGLVLLSPSDLVLKNPELEGATVAEFSLTTPLGEPVYVVGDVRFDATTGVRLGPISEDEAHQIVAGRTAADVASVTWIVATETGDEYRGGELPAWRVEISGESSAAVYVGSTTGRVRAVRTSAWRLFDFLWSLHIMDYDEREDFNHWLLRLTSALGLVTVASGLLLYFLTQRWVRIGAKN